MSIRKTQTCKGVKVRPRGKSWQVDFETRDGKRNQKSYSTLEEAKNAIADFTLERVENDRLARIDEKNTRFGLYDLTDVERLDVMTAIERLGGHASLTEAEQYWEILPKRAPGIIELSSTAQPAIFGG